MHIPGILKSGTYVLRMSERSVQGSAGRCGSVQVGAGHGAGHCGSLRVSEGGAGGCGSVQGVRIGAGQCRQVQVTVQVGAG